jgi:hypothetical protein
MSVRQLIIGGLAVPVYASTEIAQTYVPVRGATSRRTAAGGNILRVGWDGKLRTIISGSGLIPAGLQTLDYSAALTLSCIQHRAVNSATNTITIPAARRTDAGSTPYGRALVGDVWVPTAVTGIVSNVATLTAVSGATQYQCVYFPELSVHAEPPTEDKPRHGPVFGWTLEAEEV